MSAAPMHAADWVICAIAAVVMLAATWWVLYAPSGRSER